MKFIYFIVLSLSLFLNTARASQEDGDKRIEKNSPSSDSSQITIHSLPSDIIGAVIDDLLPRDAISFLMTCGTYYNYEISISDEKMQYISIMQYNEKFLRDIFEYQRMAPVDLLFSIKHYVGNYLRVYSRAKAFKENQLFEVLPEGLNSKGNNLYRDLFFLLDQDKVKSFKDAIQDNQHLFTDDMDGYDRARIISGLAQAGLTTPQAIEQFLQATHTTEGLFTDDMDGYDRARIISGLAQGGLTTPQAIEQFLQAIHITEGLFTDDMDGYDRAEMIRALAKTGLTTPQAIEQFLQAIHSTEGLFTDDMTTPDRLRVIRGLARARLTTPEVIQSIAELFTDDMDGMNRAEIVEALGKAGLTRLDHIRIVAGLFTDDMDGYERARIISRYYQ